MHILQFLYSYILPVCVLAAVCGTIPFAMPYFGFVSEVNDFVYDIRHVGFREWVRMKRHYYRMGWSSLSADLVCLLVGVCAILTIILLVIGKMNHLTV